MIFLSSAALPSSAARKENATYGRQLSHPSNATHGAVVVVVVQLPTTATT